ncbi:uncharacterized protein EDB91DRAFT_125032 [Suillus paluster]|uniref:uncharacterized protein n=1 Tax=Suillus paluster TaxID=48578 RepID=UPI001B8770B4|nr:uncharacterized protein EDB91DRAFT_125032 [Suillus paluster]KAG1724579.1 hypothetical protein EDB91DRAFT_125032 [Suillus paluster]
MKFISLNTMIISAAAIAVTATALQIIGIPCAYPDEVVCGGIPGFNFGYPIWAHCGPSGTITSYINCTCPTCCLLDDPYTTCDGCSSSGKSSCAT